MKILGLGLDAALSGTSAADPAETDTRGVAGLLYALLTGYWPGEGVSRLPRAPAHDGIVRSPGQVRPGIPAILDTVTARALDAGTSRAGPDRARAASRWTAAGRRAGAFRRKGQGRPIRTPDELARELRRVTPESIAEQAWHLPVPDLAEASWCTQTHS